MLPPHGHLTEYAVQNPNRHSSEAGYGWHCQCFQFRRHQMLPKLRKRPNCWESGEYLQASEIPDESKLGDAFNARGGECFEYVSRDP